MNKMLRTIIFLFILFNQGTVYSQVSIAWVARYNVGYSGNAGLGITSDDSGYVYVTGDSHGGPTRQDLAVIKYSPTGASLWSRRVESPTGEHMSGNDIKLDKFDNVIVGGSGLYKYDKTGNLVWGISNVGYGVVELDSAENAFGISGNYFYITQKVDNSGISQWNRNYPFMQYSFPNVPKDMCLDNQGNVLVTGQSRLSGVVNDFATVKYSNSGNEIWVRRYNGGNEDAAYAITTDDSNNVYVTGWNSNSSVDILTIKYSPAGDTIWKTVYDGGGGDIGYDIEVDSLGFVYVGGVTNSSSYITLKYDPYGNLMWSRVQLSYLIPWFPKLKLDKNRNVYMSYVSFRPGLYENYAVVKYNNDGVQQWIAEYNNGGSSTNIIRAMDVDLKGNVYVTGNSGGSMATVKFVQTPTEINTTSTNLPESIMLFQNYPNPFNPSTIINYQCSMFSDVSLKVYDVLGNEVATLVNERKNVGTYQVKFDGSNLSSGIYYYKIKAGEYEQVRKMMLIK